MDKNLNTDAVNSVLSRIVNTVPVNTGEAKKSDVTDVGESATLYDALKKIVDEKMHLVTKYINQIAQSRVVNEDDKNIKKFLVELLQEAVTEFDKENTNES